MQRNRNTMKTDKQLVTDFLKYDYKSVNENLDMLLACVNHSFCNEQYFIFCKVPNRYSRGTRRGSDI
jgi:hypothetical protein